MGKKLKVLNEQEMADHKNRFSKLLEYSFINKEADLLLDEDDDESENQIQPGLDQQDVAQNQNIPGENTQDQVQPDENQPNISTEPEIQDTQNIEVPEMDNDSNDEVEIDVTDLTDKQDSIENKVDMIGKQTQAMFDTINKITNGLQDKLKTVDVEMSTIKDEIIKRNPTSKEVLQKRITLSDPFTQTPDDYWNKKQKNSNYNLSDDDQQTEYELKTSDIDTGNPYEIYKSFGINDDEWNQSMASMFR